MNNFNPMLDYQRNQLMAQQAMIQNQLNQLNQITHQQSQFNPYPQNNQPQIIVRQIGSIDEGRSFPVDPGITYVFLNVSTGEIYLKTLNLDNGKSEFYIYTRKNNVEEKKNDPIEQINIRLSNIETIIGGLYDKSVSNDADDSKSDGGSSATDDGSISTAKPSDVSANPTNDKRKK